MNRWSKIMLSYNIVNAEMKLLTKSSGNGGCCIKVILTKSGIILLN